MSTKNVNEEDISGNSSQEDEDNRGIKRKEAADAAEDDDDEKKAERRAANRRSAFQSRQRRKVLIEDLQKTVATLSKENTELRNGTNQLRAKLETAMLENQLLRKQQKGGGGGPGPGPTSSGSNAVEASMTAGTPPAAAPSKPPAPVGSPSMCFLGNHGGVQVGAAIPAEQGPGLCRTAPNTGSFAAGNPTMAGLNKYIQLQKHQSQASSQGLAGAAGGGLQQQLAMLLAGSGRSGGGNDETQQQLALLQAALNRTGGSDPLSQAMRALVQNAGMTNLQDGSSVGSTMP